MKYPGLRKEVKEEKKNIREIKTVMEISKSTTHIAEKIELKKENKIK